MSNAIIIHGMPDEEEYFSESYPSPSNSHWIPWLQSELLKRGVLTQTPEMPMPYLPNYEDWAMEFERFTVNDGSILIGHSCGAGFLVRWLSENHHNASRLILVAPWIDPNDKLHNDFFDFTIDPLLPKRMDVYILYSTNDDVVGVVDSVEILKNNWPGAKFTEYSAKGHFTFNDLGSNEFPDLLKMATE